MAKRRRAIEVTLNKKQRKELERLWFIYGNYGSKSTPGNHGFIQGFLEHGQDLRHMRNKFTTPTPECEAAVDAILASNDDETAS